MRRTYWDIALAAMAALTQFIAAWLGWQITIKPIRKDEVRRKKRYKVLFVTMGFLGVTATTLTSFHTARSNDKQQAALGLNNPNLIPNGIDGIRFSEIDRFGIEVDYRSTRLGATNWVL